MFITFEGIEGSGKGTAIESTRQWLEQKQQAVLLTREPGGSPLGRELRAFLLDARQQIVPEAELFLYLADRAQHVRQIIRPALDRREHVISDRYADSTIVYQGHGRGLDVNRLYELNCMAVGDLWPDLTILLDVSPETGLERARARNKAMGLEVLEGRFEAESLAFHQRVRQGYLAWAGKHPGRFRIVDGSLTPDAVFNEIKTILKQALG
jgi:dTMP kinase